MRVSPSNFPPRVPAITCNHPTKWGSLHLITADPVSGQEKSTLRLTPIIHQSILLGDRLVTFLRLSFPIEPRSDLRGVERRLRAAAIEPGCTRKRGVTAGAGGARPASPSSKTRYLRPPRDGKCQAPGFEVRTCEGQATHRDDERCRPAEKHSGRRTGSR
jgi:hypothetical protein